MHSARFDRKDFIPLACSSRLTTVRTNSHQNSRQTILASPISRGQFSLNSLFCWCREGGSNLSPNSKDVTYSFDNRQNRSNRHNRHLQAQSGHKFNIRKQTRPAGGTRLELTISSMPWKPQKAKLLTIKWLLDGKTGKTGPIGGL
jgi:hypothetical protein